MKKPVIHVYAVCKNEIEFLPFFFQHYENDAERIVIYDNQSTDGSREFVAGHPKGVVKDFDTRGEMNDLTLQSIKNVAWKESIGRADWVIVSDLDELAYHPRLPAFLEECRAKGVTIPHVRGFNMISDTFPERGIPVTEQVKHGAYSRQFTKHIVFDPNRIREIRYSPGGHTIAPEGEVHYGGRPGFKLLHYRYMGSLARLQERWDTAGKELSAINIRNNWGIKRLEPAEIARRVEYVRSHAEEVIFDRPPSLRVRLGNYLRRERRTYI